jgi:hypothetical protein
VTFDEYTQSLECLTQQGEPLWERIRAAYEAGVRAGEQRAAYPSVTTVQSDTWYTRVEPT